MERELPMKFVDGLFPLEVWLKDIARVGAELPR
jgi:hypothetical protein